MPQGKALDISQVGPVEGVDSRVSGSNQFVALQGADVVIVTAGVCKSPLDVVCLFSFMTASLVSSVVSY